MAGREAILAINALKAFDKDGDLTAFINSLTPFFDQHITSEFSAGTNLSRETGASLAMVAVNALATDNRLDEKRHQILQYIAEVITSLRPLGTPLGDPFPDTSSSAARYFTNSEAKRFPLLPGKSGFDVIDTSLVSVGPDIASTIKPDEVFCSVGGNSIFKYLPPGAITGWGSEKFQTKDSYIIESRWKDIEKKGNNYIIYPKDELVFNKLTWIAPAEELEKILSATPPPKAATPYRDKAGLGKTPKETHLWARFFPGELLKDATIYRPRFCDQINYPWFMVGAPEKKVDGPHWQPCARGQTCCLFTLDDHDKVVRGMDELVVHGLHGKDLNEMPIEVRYLGEVTEDPCDKIPLFLEQCSDWAINNRRSRP